MTFTALFTYKGRQFVRQVDGDDPTAASRKWGKAVQLPEEHTPPGLAEATEADTPAPLKGMSGVFTQVLTFGSEADYGVLTLVKTAVSRTPAPPVPVTEEG